MKNQQFASAFDGMLKSGNGVCVGQPITAHPALRGGVESEESMATARRFLPRQVIISSLRCSDGALQICCDDGRIIMASRPLFEPPDATITKKRATVITTKTTTRTTESTTRTHTGFTHTGFSYCRLSSLRLENARNSLETLRNS